MAPIVGPAMWRRRPRHHGCGGRGDGDGSESAWQAENATTEAAQTGGIVRTWSSSPGFGLVVVSAAVWIPVAPYDRESGVSTRPAITLAQNYQFLHHFPGLNSLKE